MEGTHVMTLGNLGRGLGAQISPHWGYNPMPGHRTASPQQPQNLPRPTLQNGPHALGRLTRTVGNVVEVAALGNLGKVMGMLGAVDDAPQPPPPADAMAEPAGPMATPNYGNDPYAPLVDQGWMTPGQVEAYKTWAKIMVFVRPISSTASAYHGYKRHGGSIGWAIGWAFMGALFPLLTPTIGYAQGWGTRKR